MYARKSTALIPTDDDPGARQPDTPVAPVKYLFGGENAAAPEPAPEPPEQAIQYERGSLIYATDGPVGTLKQIVIDEEMAEVKALVVRMTSRKESVLVPPDLVDRSVGGALQLNVTQAQFARGASRSPRFEARMFTGADTGAVSRAIPVVFRGDPRRSVVRVSRDRVETGASPGDPPAAPASRSRKRLAFWK